MEKNRDVPTLFLFLPLYIKLMRHTVLGRRGRAGPPPPLPPGKLNIADYSHVSQALGRLQVLFSSIPLVQVIVQCTVSATG